MYYSPISNQQSHQPTNSSAINYPAINKQPTIPLSIHYPPSTIHLLTNQRSYQTIRLLSTHPAHRLLTQPYQPTLHPTEKFNGPTTPSARPPARPPARCPSIQPQPNS